MEHPKLSETILNLSLAGGSFLSLGNLGNLGNLGTDGTFSDF